MVENKDEDVRDMMPDEDEKSEFGKRAKVVFKKKICKFCSQNLQIDYKNLDSIKRFVTERGKILPRRITGTCAKHQRALTKEVKRCRVLALLPFVKQ